MSHSHSRLKVFSDCPLSYKLQYIDKVPTESNSAMEIGAAAHEFFDQFIKGEQFFSATEEKTFNSYVEKLSATCFQSESRDQSNFKDYLEICRTFAKSYKVDPEYPRVFAERQVAFDRQWKECKWDSPDAYFRAKIDLMQLPAEEPVKKIKITDFKTGFSGGADSYQLDIYSLVASLLYPSLEQVQVDFYYVKSGFKQVKLLEVKDLDITKVQIEALAERIEGETKWKAKPGARCLNCNVSSACTEKPSNLVAINSMDIAKKLGEEIAFLDAQTKAKKKALKSYCEKNGPVHTGGLIYNNFPTESVVISIAPLLSLCVQYNIDPADILNPDSTKFKKLCRNNPGFAEAVGPYVGMEVATRFYAKKDDEDKE